MIKEKTKFTEQVKAKMLQSEIEDWQQKVINECMRHLEESDIDGWHDCFGQDDPDFKEHYYGNLGDTVEFSMNPKFVRNSDRGADFKGKDENDEEQGVMESKSKELGKGGNLTLISTASSYDTEALNELRLREGGYLEGTDLVLGDGKVGNKQHRKGLNLRINQDDLIVSCKGRDLFGWHLTESVLRHYTTKFPNVICTKAIRRTNPLSGRLEFMFTEIKLYLKPSPSRFLDMIKNGKVILCLSKGWGSKSFRVTYKDEDELFGEAFTIK
tara:strand:+ start:33 stop:842 length:810 start_codon:yes stop_codon:yes gene_type:complete